MSYLYAVRMLIPCLDPQPVKVGFSTVPHKRRLVYGSGPYKCEWLGIWPGTMKDELNFHLRFIDLHVGLAGEWFLPNKEAMRFINRKINAYNKVLAEKTKRKQQAAESKARAELQAAAEMESQRERAGRIMDNLVSGLIQ